MMAYLQTKYQRRGSPMAELIATLMCGPRGRAVPDRKAQKNGDATRRSPSSVPDTLSLPLYPHQPYPNSLVCWMVRYHGVLAPNPTYLPAFSSTSQERNTMRLTAVIILLFSILTVAGTSAESVALQASRDNTLYEDPDGALSNGSGSYLFVGFTNNSAARRALLYFDVAAAVPAGATINEASLTLTLSKTVSGAQPIEIHQCQVAPANRPPPPGWGEGTSVASGQEGKGASAAPGDATWIHSSFSDATWANAGGDFATEVSASTTVDALGAYTWESAGLVADVQAWLDSPARNFGWILVGEEEDSKAAKRFNSRENSSADTRPLLTIDYSIPPPIPTAVGSITWAGIKGRVR